MKEQQLHLLVYGKKDGKYLHINEVSNGLKCNCTCPCCNTRLIAKQGKKREHHFAHVGKNDCGRGMETTIHSLAKEIIQREKKIPIPNNEIIPVTDIFLEKKHQNIIPDITAMHENEKIFIEIYVTNTVNEDKFNKICELKIPTIQINLSHLLNLSSKKLENILKQELYKTCNAEWIYQPKKLENCSTNKSKQIQKQVNTNPVEEKFPKNSENIIKSKPIDKEILESIKQKKELLKTQGEKIKIIPKACQCPNPITKCERMCGSQKCLENYYIPLNLCKKCPHCFCVNEYDIYCGYGLREDENYDLFTLIHEQRKIPRKEFNDYMNDWEKAVIEKIHSNILTKTLKPML